MRIFYLLPLSLLPLHTSGFCPYTLFMYLEYYFYLSYLYYFLSTFCWLFLSPVLVHLFGWSKRHKQFLSTHICSLLNLFFPDHFPLKQHGSLVLLWATLSLNQCFSLTSPEWLDSGTHVPVFPRHLPLLFWRTHYSYLFCQTPETHCLLWRVISRSFLWKEGVKLKWLWQPGSLISIWDVSPWGQLTRVPPSVQRSKKVSSRTEMEMATRVLHNECPLPCSLWTLPLQRQRLKGSWPILSPGKTRTFPVPRRRWAGVWVSSKFIALSPLSLQPLKLGRGRGGVWLTDLSHLTFWKC